MDDKKPILHILVVGFHHKKGCQVEFSYPPLIAGSEGKQECPSGWKYLPTLAIPDGSHNFNKDFVCFNLPSLTDPHESIYGISCYRQIPVEELKIRTADVTRSTVQKSVCALLSIPIYGYVEVKLSLIAQAFFEQGDFSCTDILVKAHEQLNACLHSMDHAELTPARLHYVGLPLRELILKWRHKLLILYKLLLLQKRIICFGSPVQPICALILGIVSLHPELLSEGFQEVACVKTSRPLSPMPNFGTPQEEKVCLPSEPNSPVKENTPTQETLAATEHQSVEDHHDSTQQAQSAKENDTISTDSAKEAGNSLEEIALPADEATSGNARPTLTRETSVDTIASNFSSLCAVKPSEWGAPIRVFYEGNLCLPYISLPYMDLLTDPSVKGYIIGASNVLFQQKRQLADVIVDVENAMIDIYDMDLKRQAQLSTEDLRFTDYIIRNVQNPKEDAEGSEVWIREQFYGYMVALLKSSIASDPSKEEEHFNVHFMTALKTTQCYQDWLARGNGEADHTFEGLVVGHPFAGTLSVADMKLRIAQTMQNSESGRKLNHAVNSTSRAVGGAISTAKGAFSTWWTSITAPVVASQPQSESAQANDVLSNNNNSSSGQDSDLSDSDGFVGHEESDDSNYSDSDQSQSDSNRNVVKPSEIVTAEHTIEKSNNIVEIGKEAEILDRQQRIYTV
ncbi:late secretory pathway protein AVL9 homolog [Toxorhynchites rutilus septentrionalis]|uniref:late secretory pathway protein AVL9 homolog n=1 Tax=Toxorhynchites rutilus septentrionalis TaxID=329112 RepID=UPI00247A1692|nr:late secretory pathway protein AVL9 homolog [Toxorhynchites rutilus septentrionalis]